jgi:hypothetical protein
MVLVAMTAVREQQVRQEQRDERPAERDTHPWRSGLFVRRLGRTPVHFFSFSAKKRAV